MARLPATCTTDAPVRPSRRQRRRPASLEEIQSTWPAVVGVAKASEEAFGFCTAHDYNLIAAGQFPAKVIEAGNRKLVVTASIVAVLGGGAQ